MVGIASHHNLASWEVGSTAVAEEIGNTGAVAVPNVFAAEDVPAEWSSSATGFGGTPGSEQRQTDQAEPKK